MSALAHRDGSGRITNNSIRRKNAKTANRIYERLAMQAQFNAAWAASRSPRMPPLDMSTPAITARRTIHGPLVLR